MFEHEFEIQRRRLIAESPFDHNGIHDTAFREYKQTALIFNQGLV
jgi:hypothetical protein